MKKLGVMKIAVSVICIAASIVYIRSYMGKDIKIDIPDRVVLYPADELTSDEENEQYIADHRAVQAAVKSITDTRSYRYGSVRKRAEMLLPVFDELYEKGYIISYDLSCDDPHASITYDIPCGSKRAGTVLFLKNPW